MIGGDRDPLSFCEYVNLGDGVRVSQNVNL